ncbi:MAG: TonB-dependent receptor [FCB group bacterium]|nr:TonB-dependent receptor [FCB group bacterium]
MITRNFSRLVMIGCFLTVALTLLNISVRAEVVATGDSLIYEMNDLVVTASRHPVLYHDLARSIVVLSPDQAGGSSDIETLLRYAAGVDIRRRGASGVQADIGIRGGSFEQTLVLIDGSKTTDAQTGHHNFDLPVSGAEIDRIEILKGPAARLYGPNAFGGVINIITRPPGPRGARAEMTVGENGLFEQSYVLTARDGQIHHRAVIERRLSTGYQDNTEYDLLTLAYRNGIEMPSGQVGLSVRYGDKQFGAHRFYSDRFPDEWEATETLFLQADAELYRGPLVLTPKLFYRRHKDDFILDRNRPDWYRNRHSTDQYGLEFQTGLTTAGTVLNFGGELSGEQIKSASLGDHYRLKGGLFFEAQLSPIENLTIVPGATLYRYTDWDWRLWPGVDIGYRLSRGLRLYAAAGRSFRVPTYTELYYQSPANMGNADLKPEKSWTYEIGLKHQSRWGQNEISVFVRDGQDLIDWVRPDSLSAWQVQNAASVITTGFELSTRLNVNRLSGNLPLSSVGLRYQFLDSDHSVQCLQSKYIADHLRHQLIGDLDWRWSGAIRQNLTVRYLDRLTDDDYLIIDTRLAWKVSKLEIFAEASNLFNVAYSEVGTIPMPGRWLKAGVRLNLSN